MRILVVEDEPVAASLLAKGLREHAYAVDVADDGSAALEQVGVNDYDLMILDVLLPGITGLELCSRLRAAGVTVPILMLTARGGPDQRVEGLDAVETRHPSHDPDQRSRITDYALALDLARSGGSDWHGDGEEMRHGSLGSQEVPGEWVGELEQRRRA